MTMSWLRGPLTLLKPTFGMELANLNRVISDEEIQTCYEVPGQRSSTADELSVLRSISSQPDFLVIDGSVPKRLPFSRPQSTDDLVNSSVPLGLDRMGFQCNGPFTSGSRLDRLEDPPEMSDDEEEEEEDYGDEADDVSVDSSVEEGESEVES